MDLAFPFLFPAGGEAALAGKRGTARSALYLAPAQERPEPDLMCSFAPSVSESCRATLSRRDGWEERVSLVLSALKNPQHWAVLGTNSEWHSGWLPWLTSPGPAVLGLGSALPSPLCQQHL